MSGASEPVHPEDFSSKPSPAELVTIRRSHRWRLLSRIALTIGFAPICIFVCPWVVEGLGYKSGLALPAAWVVSFALYAVSTWTLWRCSRCGRGLSLNRADWGIKECPHCKSQLR